MENPIKFGFAQAGLILIKVAVLLLLTIRVVSLGISVWIGSAIANPGLSQHDDACLRPEQFVPN